MSFFKDLFSSISSNKTSDKPSQNTDILTNSAKRVIPSIADCSYRNTGLNNMTFDDLKNLLKNDVFERKLNRAYGDNIAYADMLKKDIVYYYNLMDDLNEHICSILTDRRLLSVDEWMNIFSELQKKNIIHDISNTKNRDILDDYKYIYGNDLVRRLESDYTWMYINSSLLLGCISAIYEKPHFGHDLFDSPSKLVVDEINKYCENWTAHFFAQKSAKVDRVSSEDQISVKVDEVDNNNVVNNNEADNNDEVNCDAHNFDDDEQAVDIYDSENINKDDDENLTEVETYSIEYEYKHFESTNSNSSVEYNSITEEIKSKPINTHSILKKCEDDDIVESPFAKEDDDIVVGDSIVKKFEDFQSVEVELQDYKADCEVEPSQGDDISSEYEEVLSENADEVTSSQDTYLQDKLDFISEDAKISISRIAEQSFKYTNFSSSTYQDFQDFMKKNVFEKKLNRVDHNMLKYTDHLKKNILYYYNLIEDLKCHIQKLITSEQLMDTDEWMDIFAQLQVSNKVYEIEGTQNADILDGYEEIPVQNLIPNLERDYTWMYLNSNLWLGCIYAIYESPDFSLTLFGQSAECVIDEFMYKCDDIIKDWRLSNSNQTVEKQTV